MPGMGELIIILLIVLVVFGASKLPQIGDALGRSIKNFKRATKGDEDDEKAGELEEPAKEKQKQPMQIGTKAQKQLEPAGDDDGEWEEVVVRRRKKSASSSES